MFRIRVQDSGRQWDGDRDGDVHCGVFGSATPFSDVAFSAESAGSWGADWGGARWKIGEDAARLGNNVSGEERKEGREGGEGGGGGGGGGEGVYVCLILLHTLIL